MDRRVDGMKYKSAPHQWDEAQYQPPRGVRENVKNVPAPLKAFSYPRNGTTPTSRITAMICFHPYRHNNNTSGGKANTNLTHTQASSIKSNRKEVRGSEDISALTEALNTHSCRRMA